MRRVLAEARIPARLGGVILVGAILWGPGYVAAGDHHTGADLRCSECHTMHASRSHAFEAYLDGRPGTGFSPNPRPPQDRLLVDEGTNATCLSCHADGAPDVYGAEVGNPADNVRPAGALNGVLGSYSPGTGYFDTYGHTLNSTIPPPGADTTVAGNWGSAAFNCADCHEVHGSVYYRNLAPRFGVRTGMVFNADQSPTYTIRATIDYAFDVTESAPGEYDSRNAWFATAGGANRMNAYCGKCHGNFHASSEVNGTSGAFKRHPTSGAVVGVATTGVALLVLEQVNSEIRPVWQSAGVAEVGCLTCHKAHGNKRPFALIYPGNNPTLPSPVDLESGTAPGEVQSGGTADENVLYPLRNLCANCHPMGRPG